MLRTHMLFLLFSLSVARGSSNEVHGTVEAAMEGAHGVSIAVVAVIRIESVQLLSPPCHPVVGTMVKSKLKDRKIVIVCLKDRKIIIVCL